MYLALFRLFTSISTLYHLLSLLFACWPILFFSFYQSLFGNCWAYSLIIPGLFFFLCVSFVVDFFLSSFLLSVVGFLLYNLCQG